MLCSIVENNEFHLNNSDMEEEILDVAKYVEQMALLIDLQLQPEHRSDVVQNLERIRAMSQLVNEFFLANNIEAAPIFEP